jgi:surface antigen
MPRPLSAVAATALLASCLAACAGPSASGSREGLAVAPATNGVHLAATGAAPQHSGLRVVDEDSAVAQTLALWRAVTRAPIGAEVTWSNPRSGDHGQALILREAAIPDSDRVCREYRRDDVVGGTAHRTVGQVCQQRDGSWAVISGGGIATPPVPLIETENACHDQAPLRLSSRRLGTGTALCRQPDGSWAIGQG